MAYNLQSLNVASLDFTEIKSSLTNFLKQQTDLSDLDFDNNASAVNMLINILATATAYNGVYSQYGYLNSFATTTTTLQSLLGIASNNSVLLEPTKTAFSTRTITTAAGSTLAAYTAFTAISPNGSELFFYNKDAVPANTTAAVTLYCGTVISYTEFDYDTQSIDVPYTIDPDTLTFEVTNITTGSKEIWTRVTDISKANTGNEKHYAVINSNLGYTLTTNIPTAQQITTQYTVVVTGIISSGSAGNSSIIQQKTGVTFNTQSIPSNGYDTFSLAEAKTQLKFKAIGRERCVTINDYKNAIMDSGLSYTDTESNITVQNGDVPGQVKVYVAGMGLNDQAILLFYLSARSLVGIQVTYGL
jgi:hypothetical protein